MSRNKYPEETFRKIIEVSTELFMTKGYDNTSMQDIVEKLGMTKGAIYHHFPSKEVLLEQVCENYYSKQNWFLQIQKCTHLSGLEKLQALFSHELLDQEKIKMDRMTKHMFEDRTILVERIKAGVQEASPCIEALIKEGISDGSIQTDFAKEIAEVLLILINFWINPTVFVSSKEEYKQKVLFLKEVLDKLGVPILTSELLEASISYYDSTM